jgi:glutaredoxin
MKTHISWAEGRKQHRLNLSLADKSISKTVVCHYSKNLSRLIALAKTTYAEELYNKLTIEEKCHFLKLADSQLGITLRTILDTHSDKLRSQISKKKGETRTITFSIAS